MLMTCLWQVKAEIGVRHTSRTLGEGAYLQGVWPTSCSLGTECFEPKSLCLLRGGLVQVHLKQQTQLIRGTSKLAREEARAVLPLHA